MLRCSSSYVQRWRERFLASRLAGLVARHQGRKVRPDAAKLEARILEWTRRGPQDGTTHWSSRRLAVALGTNHMTVSRVWARHGLQPYRVRRYMLSEDPDFEKKAADIIGLYLNPPDHAAVFCVALGNCRDPRPFAAGKLGVRKSVSQRGEFADAPAFAEVVVLAVKGTATSARCISPPRKIQCLNRSSATEQGQQSYRANCSLKLPARAEPGV